MTLGQKLKKLRTEKGLTQKDLADQLHVTFQTVSKWETGTNEPDIATLKELSKLFGCSLDCLLNDDEETPIEKEKTEVVVKEVPVIKETIIVHQNEAHVCARCEKDIPEDELVSEDVTKKERHGPYTRTVSIGQTYYHKDCLEEVKKERAEAEKKAKILRAKSSRKKCFGWGIAAGVTALVIALAIFLCNMQIVHPALGVLYSFLIGYGIFAMIYCILSGSYIGDVFMWCAGSTIKFPGLIFTWNLGGFAWLIAMKILFAILGFLIGVLALLFAIAFSATLGAVSFPFILIHNVRTDYEDAF
jgi:transcriptional regulator with XRE-family HTH domain